VTMPGVGEHYDAEQSFGSVEAVKTVSDLFMPLAGTIAEVNTDLDANPQHVNEDPYGQGWMVRVTLDDPAAVNDLMDADAYAAHAG
jgi:glycine cleavage system H protein